MSISEAMEALGRQGIERLEAQMLLLHALGRTTAERAWLFAHDERSLLPSERNALEKLAQQRVQGVPLAYLLGYREFFGRRFVVTPDVLIPRPDSETLVSWAIESLAHVQHPHPTVLELGTGSGALGISIALAYPNAQVVLTDISPSALEVASRNAQALGARVRTVEANWLDGTAAGEPVAADASVDLIVSNPPYIAQDDPHLKALQFEPALALVSGKGGLQAIETIVKQSRAALRQGAWLLLEHGYSQARQVQALMRSMGFSQVQTRNDLGGNHRCTGGQWSSRFHHPDHTHTATPPLHGN